MFITEHVLPLDSCEHHFLATEACVFGAEDCCCLPLIVCWSSKMVTYHCGIEGVETHALGHDFGATVFSVLM